MIASAAERLANVYRVGVGTEDIGFFDDQLFGCMDAYRLMRSQSGDRDRVYPLSADQAAIWWDHYARQDTRSPDRVHYGEVAMIRDRSYTEVFGDRPRPDREHDHIVCLGLPVELSHVDLMM